jgi:ssDNA-binding Zn-finger/Zn-ribbon topoisomerase 1
MKCPKCSGGAVVGEGNGTAGNNEVANDMGGEVVVKKGGRFRRVFYGCSRYPDCDFVTNKDPRKFKWDPEEAKAKGKGRGMKKVKEAESKTS